MTQACIYIVHIASDCIALPYQLPKPVRPPPLPHALHSAARADARTDVRYSLSHPHRSRASSRRKSECFMMSKPPDETGAEEGEGDNSKCNAVVRTRVAAAAAETDGDGFRKARQKIRVAPPSFLPSFRFRPPSSVALITCHARAYLLTT